MGTRNSVIAIVDGKMKVAQYGQWDGYPSGQGNTLLRALHKYNLEDLKEKIKALTSLSDERADEISKIEDWPSKYPHLSRNAGAEIVRYIMEEDIKEVNLQEDFPADSLFCEWCYVVDFDKRTLEVYTGFNKEPLKEEERFYYLQTKISENDIQEKKEKKSKKKEEKEADSKEN